MKSKPEEKATARVLKNVYGYFLKSAWKQNKLYFFARFMKLIFSSMTPFVSLLLVPMIIEELMGGQDAGKLIRYTALIVILNFVLWVADGLWGSIADYQAQKFANYYGRVLSRRIMELSFLHTENKKVLDQLELAKNGMSWYSGGLNGLVEPLCNMMSQLITLVGVVVLIVLQAPAVFIITLVLLIGTTWINSKLNRIEQDGYKKLSKINRIFGYLGWNLTDFRYGKDIRLYDAKDMLIDKWSSFTDEMNHRYEEIANKQLPLQLLEMGIDVIRDFGTYFYLGYLALTGQISIAVTTQMINAAGTFSGSLSGIIYNFQTMIKRANYANEFVKFLDYEAALPSGTKPVRNKAHVFEFDNVTFSYPGSEVKVLSGVNLKIEEGQHLSVVGLNGAGKTTMIKLLCRLYTPTEGEIRMDGVNVKEYDYEQYMSVFAPVFQDFKLFAFPISENLLLSEEKSEEKNQMLDETLRKVGIHDRIETMPNSIDTVLFQYFDANGIEPSGGEQQKLAIARALIKDAPVVVLDEPTAALDPIAEYEIYSQFQELVKGKTAIFISHRLSSCQFCDKIAVFSDGYVKEYGTHAELVKLAGGVYADMFASQAKYYQKQ